ncbi:hypothetical protein D0815_11340 [Vibrio parahaemolyticus]|nr:hypothetical protein [Vibrio parahaemolyticus]EGR0226536.1 hypothetical protein [Vibrio parahaemolyticus]EGR0621617.1 hypothetical protein [Vibrio parahaemolyticus]EGR1219173.1 hypothetical protein [Vibrio parahaemolyticus]EGR1363894.1 hypothetical protein [Vibrio parahaemolyticus]
MKNKALELDINHFDDFVNGICVALVYSAFSVL